MSKELALPPENVWHEYFNLGDDLVLANVNLDSSGWSGRVVRSEYKDESYADPHGQFVTMITAWDQQSVKGFRKRVLEAVDRRRRMPLGKVTI